MDNKTLYQSDIRFNKKCFEITEDSLSVNSRKLLSRKDYSINFEDIGFKPIKSKAGKKGWLIATLFFFFLAIGLFIYEKSGDDTDKNGYLVYVILGLISFAIYFVTFKSVFYLANYDNTNAIEFLIDKPNKIDLDNFIDTLKRERNSFLIEKYGQMTKLLSYEQQFNTLNWLNRIEALSKEDYDNKIEELKSLFTQPNSIIGFQNRR